MKSCISLLPDSQQEVIRMHEYQGLTHIEIAKRLHNTISGNCFSY